MKALGLDLGDKSLGIAISDTQRMFARGVANVRFEADDETTPLAKTLEMLDNEPVSVIVLGYPKNMDGTIGAQAKKSEVFKSKIQTSRDIEVVLMDERLTSKMANQAMIHGKKQRKKRKASIDQTSAVVLLQNYLDKEKERENYGRQDAESH